MDAHKIVLPHNTKLRSIWGNFIFFTMRIQCSAETSKKTPMLMEVKKYFLNHSSRLFNLLYIRVCMYARARFFPSFFLKVLICNYEILAGGAGLASVY